MKRLFRSTVLAATGVALALLLTPQRSHAQQTVLAANLFATAAGERHGLAYDAATGRLFTVERATTLAAPQLRAYTLNGTLVSGPHALSGTTGALTAMGLHFLRGNTSIGGQAVPAGTLVYLRDATLYALDKTDGSVMASEAVDINFDTGGLCTKPLGGAGKGLGYSTRLGRFLSTNSCCNCSGVAEFIAGGVTGFIPVPVPGSSGAGGVKEHPASGNIWVGNAPDINSLSEFSQQRVLLRQFEVFEAGTLGLVAIMRLAFDATGQRLWLLGFDGVVYQINGQDISSAVPVLGPEGIFALALLLGLSALWLGRWAVPARRETARV
jgi:hypothetical protein